MVVPLSLEQKNKIVIGMATVRPLNGCGPQDGKQQTLVPYPDWVRTGATGTACPVPSIISFGTGDLCT
jgi:hypothetical protein